MTTEQVQAEIERLKNSPYVKLAKKEENNALKQRMYQLRYYEKKGRAIAEERGLKIEEGGKD
jgi:hypothetical protein